MPHKTLYIRPADKSLWDAAQRVADKAGVSVSQIVADALKNDLPRADAAADETPADAWAHIAADAA